MMMWSAFFTNAQEFNGIIEYEREQDWIEIMSNLPFMTQEEIDRRRLTWGNRERRSTTYELYITNNKSVYKEKEEEDGSGYSWRKAPYLVIRDYGEKTIHDQVDLLEKTYVIEEDAPRIKWKILNEIKEVAGYICMKAETIDPVGNKVVHAWFTDKIPVFGGPEGYYGLPGMILALEFNNGEASVIATKVTAMEEPVELPIPDKIKGKEITLEEYQEKCITYYEESIEGRKYPYRGLRY